MDINECCEYWIKSVKIYFFVRKLLVVLGMMIFINGFFFNLKKNLFYLIFCFYYEIEFNRIIKMYYFVEILLKLELEFWF